MRIRDAISHSGYGIYHVTAFRMNSPAPIGYGSVFIAIIVRIRDTETTT